ncbi:hypothetical protein MRX96_009991 [Rhipicephalus microplus]
MGSNALIVRGPGYPVPKPHENRDRCRALCSLVDRRASAGNPEVPSSGSRNQRGEPWSREKPGSVSLSPNRHLTLDTVMPPAVHISTDSTVIIGQFEFQA